MCKKGKRKGGKRERPSVDFSFSSFPFSSIAQRSRLGLFCEFHPAKTLINSSECNPLAGKRLQRGERARIPLDSGVGDGKLRNTRRRKLAVGNRFRRNKRAEASFPNGETCLEKWKNFRILAKAVHRRERVSRKQGAGRLLGAGESPARITQGA